MTTALGVLAAILTTTAWIPQLLRTFRTRHARDLSWGYVLVFGAGVALWSVYGVLRGDVAVIGANVVTLVLLGALAVLKWSTERGPDGHDDPDPVA